MGYGWCYKCETPQIDEHEVQCLDCEAQVYCNDADDDRHLSTCYAYLEARGLLRIAIVGHPRAGKTHFTRLLTASAPNVPVLHADIFFTKTKLSWTEQSTAIVRWTGLPENYKNHIVEGVKVYYALRKGYKPDVIYMVVTKEPSKVSTRVVFNKQLDNIWSKWRTEHQDIPVIVVEGRPAYINEDSGHEIVPTT